LAGRVTNHFFGYRPERVVEQNTLPRKYLRNLALERNLIPSQPPILLENVAKPEISKEAPLLAAQISKTESDPYILALKAQAEGLLDETRHLLLELLPGQKLRQHEADKRKTESPQLAEEETDRLHKIYLTLARNEIYSGRYHDAPVWYEKAAALKPISDAALLNEFGMAWWRVRDYKKARQFWIAASDIRENSLGISNVELAPILNNLAGAYAKEGKYDEAEDTYVRTHC
jgi:tetratricopeptide (TPR) repeat protein